MEFREPLSNQNAYSLQIVYEFPLLYLPFQSRVAQPIQVTIYELLTGIFADEYDT